MRTHIAIALLAVAVTSGPALAHQTTEPQWWDLRGVGTEQPSARVDATMAPSPATGEMVLFGGTDASGDRSDTWVFSIRGWVQRATASSPPPMRWARMVYDSANHRSVLVGYSSDIYQPGPQTWFWDGERWTPLAGPSALRAEPGFSLAFDEVSREVLLFGGDAGAGVDNPCMDDTWVLAGGTQWTWVAGSHPPVQPLRPGASGASAASVSPPARVYGAMAYDRSSGRIVLHGGFNQCRTSEQTLTDTWGWDRAIASWTELAPAHHPPANDRGYQLAYYGLGNYLVAAGCGPACGMYEPTALWKWNGTDWSQLPGPPQDPTKPWTAPRVDYGFAFSDVSGYGGLLLFGGYETTFLDETWAWGVLPEILNTAPTAVIVGPTNGVAACSVPAGTPVTFDGSHSSDAEHQTLAYLWTGPFGSRTGSAVDVPFPIGPSQVSLTVSDGTLDGTTWAPVLVTVGVQGLESPLGPLTLIQAPLPSSPSVFFEAGRTLPLKLALTCGAYALTNKDVAAPVLLDVRPSGGLDDGIATPATVADIGGVFRTQGTNWIYNLQTKGLAPGVYELRIEMPDTLRYRTLVGLR